MGTGCCAPSVNKRQTDIWLVVNVPVLSEQMTVVQPSVSTDGSFLRHAAQSLLCVLQSRLANQR